MLDECIVISGLQLHEDNLLNVDVIAAADIIKVNLHLKWNCYKKAKKTYCNFKYMQKDWVVFFLFRTRR